jgi:para-aminobenzoate synthetase/4-amino-4-deoxychorismate lyase
LSISSVFKPSEIATMAAVPDPRHGIFETLLVVDGHPVDLDAHLQRLSASVAELFPDHDPSTLGVPVEIPYGELHTGTSGETRPNKAALRIAVAPGAGRQLQISTDVRETEQGQSAVALRSVFVPGGLGAHKWLDRSLLDQTRGRLPPDALPLIVDLDGSALEVSRANLFAIRDDALFTPPLDGRILPGITRMRVLEIAAASGVEIRQEPVSTSDLLNADEVFLTSSVRGIEGTASLDGETLAGAGPLTAEVATRLRRAWFGAQVV